MTQFLVHALALHTMAGAHAAPRQAARVLGGGVPDPPPAAPDPAVSRSVNTILGWVKWGALIAGSLGLTMCAVKMMVGHRNRSTFAADGAAGIPWVLGGLSLAAAGAGIVGVLL
jgi:hypothetical protein